MFLQHAVAAAQRALEGVDACAMGGVNGEHEPVVAKGKSEPIVVWEAVQAKFSGRPPEFRDAR